MSDHGPTVFKDRYEVHRKLARGGMSDVYLARDQVLDRPVALKVLFPEYAKDATFVARFRREAQAAARLNHPNIVGVYDWGEESGTYFIAMEYIEGRTLGEIVRAEGPLHPRRAAEAAADVAAALGFAHRNGVIHRDVKPGNVMCESSGLIKVADFGIAQAIGGPEQTQLTRAGSVMGTATYFSPEQAQGRPVDPRTDIYSLGCVLFEILTGRPPFSGETPVAIAYKHVQEPPPRPSTLAQVPAPLEAIVLKCLAKNPDERYPSAEELRADLRRFLDGHPVAALAAAGAAGAVAGAAATAAYGAADPTAAYASPVTGATPAYGDATTAMPPTGAHGYPPTGPPYGAAPPGKKKQNPWLIGALVLFLLLVAGTLIVVALRTSTSTDRVAVPSVIDQPADTAERTLRDAGFRVEREERPNDQFAAGIVFDQDPPGASEADRNSVVTIFVSTGRSDLPVPDVKGLMIDQARSRLSDFTIREVPVPHPTEPVGKVLEQDPAGGSRLARGGQVTLTVSAGSTTVPVPDVSGRPTAQALIDLREAGFVQCCTVRQEPSDELGAGRVTRTEPAAGTPADKNAPLTVWESTGRASTTTTSTTTTTTTTTTTRPERTTTTESD